MNVFETLAFYFSYPFVRYALIAGVLIAMCSSLLGVTLVLKRYSYIGDGLSHVAFGAMAIGAIFHLVDNMLIVLPVTVIAAVFMLKTGQNSKINGDAVIAMISVGSLAVGYLLLNLFSVSSNVSGDVCSTLFGSTAILTLSSFDVVLCIVLAVLVLVAYLLFYWKIFAITFDENFAMATGTRTNLYNLGLAVLTAIIIVLAMNLVGSLLVSALIIFPSLSAMRLFRSFRLVVLCSTGLSVFCAVAGILVSVLLSTPVGSTIVVINIVMFVLFFAIELLIRR